MKILAAWDRGLANKTVAATALTAIAVTLHGCTVPHVDGYIDISDANVASHVVPYWRLQQDYFESSSYTDPITQLPAFNSCMDTQLNVLDVCSRRGHCVPFDENDITHPVLFCQCDADWAGTECDIRRKRQSTSWLLSLVLGPLALDELYLGMTQQAVMKLCAVVLSLVACVAGNTQAGTLAFLFPWLFDVVRLGMCPGHAKDYRVAADLPRWTFAVLTVLYAGLIAVALGVASVHFTVQQRRRQCDAAQARTGAKA